MSVTNRRILVLGGVLAGPTAAARAREIDEHAQITMITREARVAYAATGITYHLSGEVGSLDALDQERAEFFESVYRIGVWTGTEATSLDPVRRTLEIRRDGATQRVHYDALIYALGARSRPQATSIQGSNVNALRTLEDAQTMMAELRAGHRRVAIVGAGLHGIAAVDGLVRAGAEVTLIERDSAILPQFGTQTTRMAHEAIARQAQVLTGVHVVATRLHEGRVIALMLSSGQEIPTDFVLVTAGIAPRTELLAAAGAHLAPDGTVYVTDRAETSLPHVYACGICVSVPQALTGAHVWSAQGSVADKMAQVAGANAAGGSARLLPIAGSMIRRVLDVVVARTGLTEKQARAVVGANFQMTTVHAPSHDAFFPGSELVLVQLFWDRSTGRVLGAEIAGRSGVDKRIDIVATAVEGALTIEQLAAIDFAYAPPYGSQRDPVNVAATAAAAERAGLARFVTPEELARADGEVVRIDVRAEQAHHTGRIPGALSIPLESLRTRIHELDRQRSLVIYCDTGRRGYLATRVLSQHGFADVANLEGGFRSWELSGLPIERSLSQPETTSETTPDKPSDKPSEQPSEQTEKTNMNQELKTQVLRKLTYGMWVIAADAEGEREASAVTWVSQVSFQPPLVMVAVRSSSHLYQIIERSRSFALHLLAADQKSVAESFTRPTEQTATTLGGKSFQRGTATGSPILEGFACWLEARIVSVATPGDHALFTAEVVNVGAQDASAIPLVLANVGWHYGG